MGPLLAGPQVLSSATQPFLESSRNAPPHDYTKNGCVADYRYWAQLLPFLRSKNKAMSFS